MKQILATLLLFIGMHATAARLDLTPENTVTLRGPIDDRSVSRVQTEIASLDQLRGDKPYTIYLVLDSPGGDIGAGEDLIQYLLTVDRLETVTIFAASMASAIVEALPLTRHITENGTLMFHRAKVGMSGQISDGEFESRLRMIKQLVNVLETRNAQRMSVPMKWYKDAVKDELWLLGTEGIKYKAADEMSRIYCSKELINKRETAIIEFFIFSVKVQFSGCPLMRNGAAVQESEEGNYQRYKSSLQNRTYWGAK